MVRQIFPDEIMLIYVFNTNCFFNEDFNQVTIKSFGYTFAE